MQCFAQSSTHPGFDKECTPVLKVVTGPAPIRLCGIVSYHTINAVQGRTQNFKENLINSLQDVKMSVNALKFLNCILLFWKKCGARLLRKCGKAIWLFILRIKIGQNTNEWMEVEVACWMWVLFAQRGSLRWFEMTSHTTDTRQTRTEPYQQVIKVQMR